MQTESSLFSPWFLVWFRFQFLIFHHQQQLSLFFPGSHDSFTFWVDVHAPVGPDQKVYVKYLATMFSVLAKKVMVRWSMTQVLDSKSLQYTHTHTQISLNGTFFRSVFYSLVSVFLSFLLCIMWCGLCRQNLTFKEQLDAGIRYFDLRVSAKPGEPGNEIYFIHGLFGHKVSGGVNFYCRFGLLLWLLSWSPSFTFMCYIFHFNLSQSDIFLLCWMLLCQLQS